MQLARRHRTDRGSYDCPRERPRGGFGVDPHRSLKDISLDVLGALGLFLLAFGLIVGRDRSIAIAALMSGILFFSSAIVLNYLLSAPGEL